MVYTRRVTHEITLTCEAPRQWFSTLAVLNNHLGDCGKSQGSGFTSDQLKPESLKQRPAHLNATAAIHYSKLA